MRIFHFVRRCCSGHWRGEILLSGKEPLLRSKYKALVDFACLTSIVEVVVGPSNDSIQQLFDSGKVNNNDMIFLDHCKPSYTTDL